MVVLTRGTVRTELPQAAVASPEAAVATAPVAAARGDDDSERLKDRRSKSAPC